jgi:hypothetical protein
MRARAETPWHLRAGFPFGGGYWLWRSAPPKTLAGIFRLAGIIAGTLVPERPVKTIANIFMWKKPWRREF